MEVDRLIRSFTSAARAAGQDPANPDERWLAQLLTDSRASKGAGFARKYARSIGYYHREAGAKALVDGKLVRAVLRAPDGFDPLSADLSGTDFPFDLGRAQNFADNNYCAETYRHYRRSADRWASRCRGAGIDPLKPPSGHLEQWFEELALCSAYSTVRNIRNALSHLFRKNGVFDASRTAEIEHILQGLQRAKPHKKLRAATADDRRRILAGIAPEGAGVRDRVIVLLVAFSRWPCERLALINAEDCTVTEDGVTIASRGWCTPPVFLGRHAEPELDPATWIARLLEMVPATGPLFRPISYRLMRFDEGRLSLTPFHRAVKIAASRAGVPAGDISQRLKLLFALEVGESESDVVVAYSQGKKRMSGFPASDSGRAAAIRLGQNARRGPAYEALP